MVHIAHPVDLIIINNKNQILLVRRAEQEDRFVGKWSIPGGCAEIREDFETTLHREIKEELNCKIRWFKYFNSYYFKLSKTHHLRAIYFYGEIEGKVKINEEFFEFEWLDLNDPKLLKLDFAYNQKKVVKDFIKFLDNKSTKK